MRDITETFREQLENKTEAVTVENIESRRCSSDSYDGVEYSFTGQYIPVLPIIETVAKEEDMYIDSISHIDESTDDNDIEPQIVVFVAETTKYGIEEAFI